MSQSSASPDAPTEDRRILDELEHLQQAIRASRATRERAEAAFDSELRAFDTRVPHASVAAPLSALTGPLEPGSPPGAANPRPPLTLPKPNPSPAVALFDDGPAPPAPAPRSRMMVIAGATAVVVLASAGLFWTQQSGSGGDARRDAVSQPQPAVARPLAESTTAAAAAPADPHALRVDLTSLRRVWLRVSVDGRIALEREVAGGERLPFGADRSIVVRAGDAGAVTVRVGPDDQGPLGRDGQVVTRAFNIPER